MMSVGYILLCCVLFVHLGLGDAVSRIVRRNLSLFRCVKCTTFWAVLAYTLFFTEFEPVKCVALAFACSYVALWVDFLFSIIAILYEKYYKILVTEEGKRANGTQESEDC